MYAIVNTGGKQYKVNPGEIVSVEKLEGEPGAAVTFDKILMVVDDQSNTRSVGRPYLEGATVSGEIVKQKKGNKIIVFKSKRRKGYRCKQGHRQLLTDVKIKDITA